MHDGGSGPSQATSTRPEAGWGPSQAHDARLAFSFAVAFARRRKGEVASGASTSQSYFLPAHTMPCERRNRDACDADRNMA